MRRGGMPLISIGFSRSQIYNLDAPDVSTRFLLKEARRFINHALLVFLPIIKGFVRFVRWIDK
jgi:hypothetical protein